MERREEKNPRESSQILGGGGHEIFDFCVNTTSWTLNWFHKRVTSSYSVTGPGAAIGSDEYPNHERTRAETFQRFRWVCRMGSLWVAVLLTIRDVCLLNLTPAGAQEDPAVSTYFLWLPPPLASPHSTKGTFLQHPAVCRLIIAAKNHQFLRENKAETHPPPPL